jgi:hypothetical protein
MTSASGPGQRPFQVVTAVVLGFVVGFYLLLNGLVLLTATRFFGAVGAAVGLVYIAISAVDVCGGVLALSGRRRTVLRAGGLATAGLAATGLVVALTQGAFSGWSFLVLAAGAGIFLLLDHPASQRFFVGGGTR